MSLSRITLQRWPYRHTLDNGHQALSVSHLCPAFLLKEAVPGLLVTHICAEWDFHSWPGCDPLPSLFIPTPSAFKAWENHVIIKHKSSTLPLCASDHGAQSFYYGTLLVCRPEAAEEFLRQIFCVDYWFPSTAVTMEKEKQAETHQHTRRYGDERDGRK